MWFTRQSKPSKLLVKINSEVNREIRPMTDLRHYGQEDVWVASPKDKIGDCEDYALTKRDRLLALGFDPSSLNVYACNTRRERHAVLIVTENEYRYVLDNLSPWIITIEKCSYTNWELRNDQFSLL